MLNLTPFETNSLVIYSDTVTGTAGDNFLFLFTNTYSRQSFSVIPKISRRNSRFIELDVTLIGVTGQNDPENGEIYLYPEGNFEYLVFQTTSGTTGASGPIFCNTWNTDQEFWQYAETTWTICGVTLTEIDRGQAYVNSEIPCENEVEFVPYLSDNEWMQSIVYVAGTPGVQFPCEVGGTGFVVSRNIVTYCEPVQVLGGATLQITINRYNQC